MCSTLGAQPYVRLVRWAFARFYREFAWTYDTVAALVSSGQWRAWTLAALPLLRGRVLELGCGTGNLQRALADRSGAAPAIGLDLSPQMLARARRKLARAGRTARLLRADARALPFSPAAFDTLVATFPSEYIVDPATLAEVRRALRPSGQLVVIPLAQLGEDSLYVRLIDLAYRLTLQGSPRRAPALPRSALGQRIEQAGFRVQERWVPLPRSRVCVIIAE